MAMRPVMPDETAGPIVRRKLSHEVLDRLVEAIRSGSFAPDDQLPSERELMLRYGVGRPAIREAMQTLQRMGLIRITHGERARVMLPTAAAIIDQVFGGMVQLLTRVPGGLDELKEARLMFETGLARLAARNVNAEAVALLQAALAEQQAARGDQARFVAADMAFHHRIAAMSGNGLIEALSRGMLDWMVQFRRDLVAVPGAERITLAEHDRILLAITAGDADRADAAMRDHLTRASKLYSALTTKREPQRPPGRAAPAPGATRRQP